MAGERSRDVFGKHLMRLERQEDDTPGSANSFGGEWVDKAWRKITHKKDSSEGGERADERDGEGYQGIGKSILVPLGVSTNYCLISGAQALWHRLRLAEPRGRSRITVSRHANVHIVEAEKKIKRDRKTLKVIAHWYGRVYVCLSVQKGMCACVWMCACVQNALYPRGQMGLSVHVTAHCRHLYKADV